MKPFIRVIHINDHNTWKYPHLIHLSEKGIMYSVIVLGKNRVCMHVCVCVRVHVCAHVHTQAPPLVLLIKRYLELYLLKCYIVVSANKILC